MFIDRLEVHNDTMKKHTAHITHTTHIHHNQIKKLLLLL